MTKPPKKILNDAQRAELRQAFVRLLHREQRFGLRDDCRAELDLEWDQLIAEWVKCGR